MFGPTRNLRELSAVIAASDSPIGDTPLDENGRSYPIFAAQQPNGTCLYYFEGKPWQPSPGFTPRSPEGMDPTFRAQGRHRDGFETIKGCEYAAHLVFMEISERHGDEEARRIFAKYMEPSDSLRAEAKNAGLLSVVDGMVNALHPENRLTRYGAAKQLAKWNETMLPEKRFGPSGTKETKIMYQHIERLRDERDLRRGWCDWWPKQKRTKKPKRDIIPSAK
jgi:hypothetical protein